MDNYKYDLCVVGGAGHVGLPFALVFANTGMKTVIYDINQAALDTIQSGTVPFMESGAEALLEKCLAENTIDFSNTAEVVSQSRTIVITIGTPVDEFLNPVFQDIQKSFEELLPYFMDGQLLILRSTVYPGTTDWVCRWLEGHDKHLSVAFCPERVVQGKSIEEILSLPQIIGSKDSESEKRVSAFFEKVGMEIVKLSPIEAEFAKLFSNAYRYINFAVANQFFMITNSAGVDYSRVMEGVTYHYPRLQGLSSAGLAAGPCLFKDTMQLNAFAKNDFLLGQAAMNINEGLVLYIVELLASKFDLPNTSVGLLGMAFKPDNDDIRSSLSYKFKKILQFKCRKVYTTDPYVTVDETLDPLDEVLRESDVLILCVPHRQYKDLQFDNKFVVDVWNYWQNGTLV
jgi:UDP-N-acetyl-D-mannosaminuronic acid dehydrogenase